MKVRTTLETNAKGTNESQNKNPKASITHLDLFALRLLRPSGDLKSSRLALPGDPEDTNEADDEVIE